MYKWQLLTLARIEANAKTHDTTTAQIQSAKRVLLDIGIQHFPDTEIRYDRLGDSKGSVITLAWEAEGREIRAAICPNGQASPTFSWAMGKSGGPLASAEHAVRYLLFDRVGETGNCGPGNGGFVPRVSGESASLATGRI